MENILERLPDSIRKVIKVAKNFALQKGNKLYIVGGVVRDYYLSEKSTDIDIVVEGNGMELAGLVAERLKYAIIEHHKFLTATIKISQNYEIDFSTARKEVYKKPGALPDIIPSSIYEDLNRRDFTINAIAISLNKNNYLKVIDPFNGLQDIQNKVIRVLHDKSFIDDPTRAFRAIRYMTRFGFKIDENTERLIHEAGKKNVFNEVTSSRIFNEMKLLLSEESPGLCLKNLERYNLLKFFLDIKIDKNLLNKFSKIVKISREFGMIEQWRLCLIELFGRFSGDKIEKYPLDRRLINSLSQLDKFRKSLGLLSKKMKNSQLFNILKNFSDELIIYGIAVTNSSLIKANLEKYIKSISKIPTLLDGYDLKRMGIPPGPLYSEILKKVHLLRLDGKIRNKKMALKWVKMKFLLESPE